MSTSMKVSARLQDAARLVDEFLEEAAGERVSFSLIVWTKGTINYVSNAEREDVLMALEEMIARWKAGHPDIPAHKKN